MQFWNLSQGEAVALNEKTEISSFLSPIKQPQTILKQRKVIGFQWMLQKEVMGADSAMDYILLSLGLVL